MKAITGHPHQMINEMPGEALLTDEKVGRGRESGASSVNPSLMEHELAMGISVAMCTYNGSRFLREQLESILAQTMQPDELVICDDGSLDGTISLIDEVLKKAEFSVRIERNEQNLGPSKNFEKALRLCRGKIIVLSDQDDIWTTTKIARLWEAFRKAPDALFAFSDAEIVDEEGKFVGRTLWDAVGLREKPESLSGTRQLELLLRGNMITGAGMAVRASLVEIAMPIAPRWMHDHWMGLVGAALSYGIPIPERLFMYRRHAAQVIGERKMTYWQQFGVSMSTNADQARQKAQEFRHLLNRLSERNIIGKCHREHRELLEEKEKHLMERAKSRSDWMGRRFLRVLAETIRGRYWRFSSTPYSSIVRDLM